jgi:glycosyltransferase involved in cell wall biosynthesis
MKVVLLNIYATLPARRYGGVERVMWWLGKELSRRGHEVTYLVLEGACPFARVVRYDSRRPIEPQIPADADVIHVQHVLPEGESILRPRLFTLHGAGSRAEELDRDTVFISRDQAERFGSTCFIHNGFDWDGYGPPSLDAPRSWVHFLGDGAWRVKNLRGAIRVAALAGEELQVAGGFRLNFRMGFRLTLSPRVKFHGWVGEEEKRRILAGSRGLLFPVRWREPFGLAIVESLYFGCPVFGTPYGSLPEIVPPEVGFLSSDAEELAQAVRGAARFDPRRCHAHAVSGFGVRAMTDGYLEAYERVRSGEHLHPEPPRRMQPLERGLLPFG